MKKTGFKFNPKKLKAVALFLGILIILLLFSFFRDTSTLITRTQADSLDANDSINKNHYRRRISISEPQKKHLEYTKM